jgi:leader peptidase (prepilin peptidase)/N-methyltransferase
MLISRFATIFLVPLSFFLSAYGLLPISLGESIFGALFGYFFLLSINAIFKYLRNYDGIGEGDFDLMLFIGSFTGIVGCWITIMLGSMLGSLYGLSVLLLTKNNAHHEILLQTTKIPFGPFLAFGAFLFIFGQQQILHYLLMN